MPNTDSNSEWRTAAELAAELDVHEETVRAWAREGLIEVRPLPRRGRRYRRLQAREAVSVQDGAA